MLDGNLNSLQNFSELLIKDRTISVGAKAVYFYILVGTENGDIDLQSRNKIAFDLNISNQTLGKYLKELIQNRYIKCEQRKINGRFGNNCYTLQKGE